MAEKVAEVIGEAVGKVLGEGGVRGWGRGAGMEGCGTADASQRRRYAGRACDRDGHATGGERRCGWGGGYARWGEGLWR